MLSYLKRDGGPNERHAAEQACTVVERIGRGWSQFGYTDSDEEKERRYAKQAEQGVPSGFFVVVFRPPFVLCVHNGAAFRAVRRAPSIFADAPVLVSLGHHPIAPFRLANMAAVAADVWCAFFAHVGRTNRCGLERIERRGFDLDG